MKRVGHELRPWTDVKRGHCSGLHAGSRKHTHLSVCSARRLVMICFGFPYVSFMPTENLYLFFTGNLAFHVYHRNLFTFHSPLRRHVGSHFTDVGYVLS